MQSVEDFVLNCTIDFNGAGSIDELIKRLNSLRSTLATLGYSEADITKGLKKGIAYYTEDSDSQLKIWEAYNKNYAKKQDEARRNEEEKERQAHLRQYRLQQMQAQRLSGIANPFAFISAKSGIHIQQLFNNIGRLSPRVQGLGLSFQTLKGMWDFADGIAELNTKLLQLGYTSGLGAQKLADLGAAVAAFGGSAETVAQGNQKFVQQIEELKRGGGLGYLGEVAYKYGFSVDLNADWETNTQKAIAHARQMLASGDKGGAMAFLKKWDEANYTSNMMKASMSEEHVAANDAFYKSYDELGDKKLITEETQKYNEETAKAHRSWEAITNQLAAMLLPVMTKITALVGKFADFLAKSPNFLKVIFTLLGAIAGVMAVLITRSSIIITKRIAELALERKITFQKMLQKAFSGPWGWLALGVGLASAVGFAAMAGTSDVGNSGGVSKIESVAPDAVSVKDLYSGNGILSDREKYRLGIPTSDENSKQSLEYVNDTAAILVDCFRQMERAAKNMKDNLTDTANEAMTMAQYQQLATIMSNVNNSSNVANTSSSANVNVSVNQTFNEADASEIRSGIYDGSKEITTAIEHAIRRFNT